MSDDSIWTSPVIFDGDRDYAVVLDDSMDAVYLRDLCRKAAQEHHTRASNAVHATIVKRNMDKFECFAKYAERFEYVRQSTAERIARSLGVT